MIILGITGIMLCALLIGGCLYLNSLTPIITGYAAKNLASAVFISGRSQADVEALDLDFSFIKFNRNKVDYACINRKEGYNFYLPFCKFRIP